MNTFLPGVPIFDSAIERFESLIPPKGGWIAGGSLRAHFAREPIKDIDLFFENGKQWAAENLRLRNFGYETVYDNPKVTRMRLGQLNIDLVKTYFPDIAATISKFDFTVCTAGLNAEVLVLHDDFFVHLSARQLVLNTVDFPVGTLVRLQRYINKGYRICPNELRRLAMICNSANPKNLQEESLYHSID